MLKPTSRTPTDIAPTTIQFLVFLFKNVAKVTTYLEVDT